MEEIIVILIQFSTNEAGNLKCFISAEADYKKLIIDMRIINNVLLICGLLKMRIIDICGCG